MRFCPFCAQENPDDGRECAHCGKRLPAARTPPKPAPAPREVKPREPPKKPPARVVPRSAPRSLPPAEVDLPVEAAAPKPIAPPPAPTPPAPVVDSSKTPAPLGPTPPSYAALDGRLPPDGKTLPPVPVHSPSTGTLLGIGQNSRDSERRATQPLPIGTLDSPASRGDLVLAALGNEDSKDDGPTTPNPRIDPAELAGEDDGHSNGESRYDDDEAPRGREDSLTLPKPRKALVTRMENATRPADRAAARAPSPPIAPPPTPRAPALPPALPPAPLATSQQDPSIEYRASESSARPFPPADGPTHTPIMPTLALPPMPAGPTRAGIVGAVLYLPPLVRAMIARKRAQRTIRQLLHDDQHLLDQVLRDLGRAARENSLDVPAIADEMRRVKSEEQRRAKAEADLTKAADDLGREDARWNGDEAERKAAIGRHESQLKETEDELRQKGDERRTHEAERARLDGQIRSAEKRSSQAMQQAQKAELTPPEKGGGPNTAANLRLQAQEAQREATELVTPRDASKTQAEALDAPIHTLTQKIVELRAQLSQLKKDLAEAQSQHAKNTAAIDSDKKRADVERTEAQREMSQRFVNVGTMLNLHRVDDDTYRTLYGKIDELKSGLNAREATIVRLETELRTYDRSAVQTGLLTVGIIFAVLLIVAIVLMVVFSR